MTVGTLERVHVRINRDFAVKMAPTAVLVALVAFASLVNDRFWTWDNLRNLMTQNSGIALVAFGMTLVLITGCFDLSVGATYAAGAVSYAMLSNHVALPVAALLSIGLGASAGFVNGVVVTRLRINTFIGTIATSAIFSGLVYIACDSAPVQSRALNFSKLGLGGLLGVPWPLIVAVAAYAIITFLLASTVLGHYVYATGGSPEAAHLTGVPVDMVRVIAFVVMGGLAALAGMITASQLGVGQPTLGTNVAIDAFAIVVIGGTSVYGGEGSASRTVTGVLILAVLTNIFNAMAWDITRQSVAKGVVLLAAVALDSTRQFRRR